MKPPVSQSFFASRGADWAPLEADTTLYNHNWFWSAENEKKRKSLEELMDIYYKSAGHGGVREGQGTSRGDEGEAHVCLSREPTVRAGSGQWAGQGKSPVTAARG